MSRTVPFIAGPLNGKKLGFIHQPPATWFELHDGNVSSYDLQANKQLAYTLDRTEPLHEMDVLDLRHVAMAVDEQHRNMAKQRGALVSFAVSHLRYVFLLGFGAGAAALQFLNWVTT